MNKTFFEMSDIEKQLTLIDTNMDYAICAISEGLNGDIPGISKQERIDLQDSICAHLLCASENIAMLLKLVTDQEEINDLNAQMVM